MELQCVPEDTDFLPEGQQNLIRRWCGQVSVLGFNSRRYDLNLIKAHIVETSTSKKVNVAVKGRNIMFLAIAEIKFLDISNYLAPYTSLDTSV